MGLVRRGFQVRGDFGDGLPVGHVRLHGDQVNDALEIVLLADRQMHFDDASARGMDELLRRGVGVREVGVVAVHAVDDHEARQVEVQGGAISQFRADLHPADGVH